MPALASRSPVLPADIHGGLWQAHALAQAPAQVLSTGDAMLDAQLPGGGWPVGGLTEVLQPEGLHAEWRLLLPALARSGSGPVVLAGAPYLPFAPALAAQGLAAHRLLWVCPHSAAERLWATEQALRCAPVDAVVAWLPPGRAGAVRSEQLRRLQMAAADHHKLLFVVRPERSRHEASPAVLRLLLALPAGLAPDQPGDTLQVELLKRRGPPCTQALALPVRPLRLRLLLAASSGHALDRTAERA